MKPGKLWPGTIYEGMWKLLQGMTIRFQRLLPLAARSYDGLQLLAGWIFFVTTIFCFACAERMKLPQTDHCNLFSCVTSRANNHDLFSFFPSPEQLLAAALTKRHCWYFSFPGIWLSVQLKVIMSLAHGQIVGVIAPCTNMAESASVRQVVLRPPEAAVVIHIDWSPVSIDRHRNYVSRQMLCNTILQMHCAVPVHWKPWVDLGQASFMGFPIRMQAETLLFFVPSAAGLILLAYFTRPALLQPAFLYMKQKLYLFSCLRIGNFAFVSGRPVCAWVPWFCLFCSVVQVNIFHKYVGQMPCAGEPVFCSCWLCYWIWVSHRHETNNHASCEKRKWRRQGNSLLQQCKLVVKVGPDHTAMQVLLSDSEDIATRVQLSSSGELTDLMGECSSGFAH